MGRKLEQLLEDIKSGQRPTNVDLSNEGLSSFPMELFVLKDCAELINLGGNDLSELPKEMISFTKLKILFFAQNRFTKVPEQLGSLPSIRMLSFKSNQVIEVAENSLSPSLKWLILTDNQISILPRSIGSLTGLRKLMLAGNQITSLPEELQNCKELELCRLASNRLMGLPLWLLNMPKLSWLAFSGNTLEHQAAEEPASIPHISWDTVILKEKLGEGASGAVYRVSLTTSGLLGDSSGEYGKAISYLNFSLLNFDC
jgi:Leucine-rich repeat (LRR) protein